MSRCNFRILIVIVARCVCLNCSWGLCALQRISNPVENKRIASHRPASKPANQPTSQARLCQNQKVAEAGARIQDAESPAISALHWHKDFRTWQAAAIIYRRCVSKLRGWQGCSSHGERVLRSNLGAWSLLPIHSTHYHRLRRCCVFVLVLFHLNDTLHSCSILKRTATTENEPIPKHFPRWKRLVYSSRMSASSQEFSLHYAGVNLCSWYFIIECEYLRLIWKFVKI